MSNARFSEVFKQNAVQPITVRGYPVAEVSKRLGVGTHSLYDVDEIAGTSTLLREYIWMDGMPVAVVQGGVVYYIRVDHIGRPAFATDGAANIVWEVNYLPFGGVESSSGSNIDLRFPGQWFQLESGLHQNWMRDYDPTTGRYMQADPLGLVDGASVYGYARQSPMRYTDRRGERVYIVCRPLGLLGFTGKKHCSLVVLEVNCDCQELNEHQYSMGRWDRGFNADPSSVTNHLDQMAWEFSWIPEVDAYQVPPPPGIVHCEFDRKVIAAANAYDATYWPAPGPNSNTAVAQTIINAGGTPPPVEDATGYGWTTND